MSNIIFVLVICLCLAAAAADSFDFNEFYKKELEIILNDLLVIIKDQLENNSTSNI